MALAVDFHTHSRGGFEYAIIPPGARRRNSSRGTRSSSRGGAAIIADFMRATLISLLDLWTLRFARSSWAAHPARLIVFACVLSLGLWVALDWWTAQPTPQWFTANIPLFAWYGLAILCAAALLRICCRPQPGYAAILALTAVLMPLVVLLSGLAAPLLNIPQLAAVAALAAIYALAYFARGLKALAGVSQRPAALAGVAFLALFIWLTDALDVIPDVWTPLEIDAPASSGDELADTEELLFEQSGRIDQALEALKTDASPGAKSFFVGFAGVGEQKVFAEEIALASRVLGARYATTPRSLLLINDARDLDAKPLASVAALRYALRGIAKRMNLDRDVLFLAISSHGGEDATIEVSNSQLPLDDLTDDALAAALSESGIKWRVIILSACYAGAFIDALRTPQTIVVAAAAADRTSFGCSADRDLTYFGEAFYRDALPGARTFRDAFERARTAIAARERRERVEPSKPEAFFGAAMEAKLASVNAPP